MDKKQLEELISKKITQKINSEINDRIILDQITKEKILEDLERRVPNQYYSWLKHPLVLLIAGFLFTGVLGGVLNFYIQQRQVYTEYEIKKNNEIITSQVELANTLSSKINNTLILASDFREVYRPVLQYIKKDSIFSLSMEDTIYKKINNKYELFLQSYLDWKSSYPTLSARFSFLFGDTISVIEKFKTLDDPFIDEIHLLMRTSYNHYNSSKQIKDDLENFKVEVYNQLDTILKETKKTSNIVINEIWNRSKNLESKSQSNTHIYVFVSIVLVFSLLSILLFALILLIAYLSMNVTNKMKSN